MPSGILRWRYLVRDPVHNTQLSINSKRGHSRHIFPSLMTENDEHGLLFSRALPVAYYSVDAHPLTPSSLRLIP